MKSKGFGLKLISGVRLRLPFCSAFLAIPNPNVFRESSQSAAIWLAAAAALPQNLIYCLL
jgi:hypothetical protein